MPAWIDIVRDVERLAPEAEILNYTNPMSLTVLTGLRAANMPIVGLCHSVTHTVEQLAEYLDVPKAELRWRAGGVNHLSFITELTRNGEDLYPALRAMPGGVRRSTSRIRCASSRCTSSAPSWPSRAGTTASTRSGSASVPT